MHFDNESFTAKGISSSPSSGTICNGGFPAGGKLAGCIIITPEFLQELCLLELLPPAKAPTSGARMTNRQVVSVGPFSHNFLTGCNFEDILKDYMNTNHLHLTGVSRTFLYIEGCFLFLHWNNYLLLYNNQ